MKRKDNFFKMKIFGIMMVLFGLTSIIYSILYSSSSSSFWTIYIGLTILVSGLSLLGINFIGYPF
jgi:hypothetical protein